jgi:hypothetical protein
MVFHEKHAHGAAFAIVASMSRGAASPDQIVHSTTILSPWKRDGRTDFS